MKLDFTPQELSDLASMRAGLAELRRIAPEVELGKRQLPELAKEAQAARKAVDSIFPSELIAFTNKVAIAFSVMNRAELTRSAVSVSTESLTSRLAVLRHELTSATRNVKQAIAAKIKNDPLLAHGYVTRELAEILTRLETISINHDIEARVEALLTLAESLAAEPHGTPARQEATT